MTFARPAYKIAFVLASVPAFAAALVLPSEVLAAAGGIQDCTVGSTCVIGEFLYDDTSAPINDATCNIVSRYPNNSLFLDSSLGNGTMTVSGNGDGWYSKSFTAPATTGFYSTKVSCTVSGDTLSIDKSFQVNAASATDPNAVATAVWGYSGKTLDSFGSLPADIWSYSTRTVSSFGTLIADIWASATRTLTGASLSSGQLATQDDVTSVRDKVDNLSTTITTSSTEDLADIKDTVDENRLLLEQIVNKPIIENVLEDTTPGVSEKLQNTRAMANQIYVNSQYLTSQSAVMGSNWNNASGKDLLASVIELSSVLGEEGDSPGANTISGQVNWVRDSWNWEEAANINNQLTSARKTMNDLKIGLADYQKSPALYSQAKLLVKNFMALEKLIGTTSDTGSSKTLFAKIKTTGDLALSLDSKGQEVDKVLGEYVRSKDGVGAISKAGDLKNQIIALNKVPGITNALTKASLSDTKSIQNLLLGLKGIINSNQKLLALGSGKTLVNIWLEVGSIVFKTLVTNPSNLISQTVDLKYYLPREIREEDIIKTDAGLTVEYDSEKDQYFVSGSFVLSPGQTRTFSVETKDIWMYSESELDSLKQQANELYKPLEKTAYYAQGVSLKTDIDANLERIAQVQAASVTPEDKIRAYRESKILKTSVDEKLAGMRDLVTQASAAGSLFGFVGGSQSVAVWGLIIIIAAGFIFMTTYMRVITQRAKTQKKEESGSKKVVAKTQTHKGFHPLRFAAIVVATSIISAGSTAFVVNKIVTKNFEEKIQVLGTEEEKPVEEDSVSAVEEVPTEETLGTGIGGQYLVVVSDTVTGFLRVRNTPAGTEIAKVTAGDKFPFLDEQDEWYKIELEDGQAGWVSSEYTTKE